MNIFKVNMKKSIGLALAAVLCISGAFSSVDGGGPLALSEEQLSRLGKEAIAEIRKDYKQGKYDPFLKEIDASYEGVLEGEQLLGLAELRQGASLDLQWMDAFQTLQKEKNEQLLQVVSGQDSLFAEKVRSVATPETESNLFLRVHQMAPGTGKNQDENTLIALDLEYEYKAIHLKNMPYDSKAYYYALKMEQMDKTLLAAQVFEDESLKSEVLLFAQTLDSRLAKNWDQMDLRALTLGNVKPEDKAQERVLSVLKDTQEKMSSLYE